MKDYKKVERLSAYILIAPAIILAIIWIIIPIIMAFVMSFTDYNMLSTSSNVVGLENYQEVLTDDQFWYAVRNTLKFAIIVVPGQIIIGLFLAYFTVTRVKSERVFRIVYYLPALTSSVAIASIFGFLFSKYGVVNEFLAKFGVEATTWSADPERAMPLIMIMAIWSGVGFNMLVFISALKEVPVSLYEAADMDGASEWFKLRKITLPLISNQTGLLVIMGVIGSLQTFELAYVVSNGAAGSPAGTTQTIVMYIYYNAFTLNNMGYAAAAAFVLCVIIFLLTVLQRVIFKERSDV